MGWGQSLPNSFSSRTVEINEETKSNKFRAVPAVKCKVHYKEYDHKKNIILTYDLPLSFQITLFSSSLAHHRLMSPPTEQTTILKIGQSKNKCTNLANHWTLGQIVLFIMPWSLNNKAKSRNWFPWQKTKFYQRTKCILS